MRDGRQSSMTFSYYPGCTLKTTAKALERAALLAMKKLDVDFEELRLWQCCGAAYPMAQDEIASKLSAIRALAMARERGGELVTLCAACFNVLKQANHEIAINEDFSFKANSYLALEEPYRGEARVLHCLEVLRDRVGFEAVAARLASPLSGLKIAAYYGCLLLRPSAIMRLDDAENPTIMEGLIAALGAEPIVYPMRNECCGAYTIMEEKSIAQKRAKAIVDCAAAAGASCIITACPLCLYNLKAGGGGLPIFYFAEALAAALDVAEFGESVVLAGAANAS